MRTLAAFPAASLIGLCLSCQIATASTGAPPPRVQGPVPLPPAQRALEVRAGGARGDGGGPNLGALLAELGAATGATFTMSAQVSQALAQTAPNLTADVQVPAEAAWTFVESLLDHNGFALSLQTEGPTHLIAVVSLRQFEGLMPRYLNVPAERVEELADHPALLVRTVLHMEYTDVRQVANSMRALMGSAAQGGIVPIGNTDSVLLLGSAHQVADYARFLLECEAAAKAQWERQRQQGQQESPPSER